MAEVWMLSVDYLRFMCSKPNNIAASNIHSHLRSAMHTPPLIHIENAAASNTDLIHQRRQEIRVRNVECGSNLQSHGENTWISWSGVWRWKMLCLREIGSRHNSYINMILRQVAFSVLTAYFLGRQMSDVSMGVTGREWLTVVCCFFPLDATRTREAFLQRGLRWRERIC